MLILEKPDETRPNTLFWHSLIIQCLVEKRRTLPVFFRGPSRLTLPSDLALSVFHSFPLSFKLFPIFLWEFSFCFKVWNKSLVIHPVLKRGNPPHLRSIYGTDLAWFMKLVCFLHLDLLTLTCLFYLFTVSLSWSPSSYSHHNSFCSCTYFPNCSKPVIHCTSILRKPDETSWKHWLYSY